MPGNKTQPKQVAVADFIAAVPDPVRRADAGMLATLLESVTGEPPGMWGPSIVGFGRYRYRYDSEREGEMCRIGFSPRKAALTLYLTAGFAMRADLLAKLGKHSVGKGCLYIKRLADIDMAVLEELAAAAFADMRTRYPEP